MQNEPLTLIGVSDISGRVRGKAVPASDLPDRIKQGIGWTPTNEMITAFGPLGDIVNTNGTPWACCLRTFLKRAVEALRAAAGLRAYCAFEQEFVYLGAM